jgi:hypothetical protein
MIGAACSTVSIRPALDSVQQTAIAFIPNNDGSFVARDHGLDISIDSTGAALHVQRADRRPISAPPREATIAFRLVGTRPSRPHGESPLASRANFFLGNDPARWRSNVPTYARVRVNDVLPGVDVVYRGADRLEYDVVVSSEADPRQLELAVEGAEGLSIAADGSLRASTRAGVIEQQRPRAFQALGSDLRDVRIGYRIVASDRVAFDVGEYDRSRELVIDPVIQSTYFGGTNSDVAYDVAIDTNGNRFVTGYSYSSDFPTKSPLQGSLNGQTDGYLAKFDAQGGLVFSTYFGGSGYEQLFSVALDGSGNPYVTGSTGSSDLPTKNAYQSSYQGKGDALVAKFDSSGALLYSTYLGGSGEDGAGGIAVDGNGSAYVAGETHSSDLPTANASQSKLAGAQNGFVAKLDPSGSSLVYSTYIGGSGNDYAIDVDVDTNNAAYVVGTAESTDFPTKNPFQKNLNGLFGDAFVAKFDASGSLVYSTYLGGAVNDGATAVVVDGNGCAYVAGNSSSMDFPTTQNAWRKGGGGFLTKFAATGTSLVFSTYIGSSNIGVDRIAIDSSGSAYVSGVTGSPSFPVLGAVQSKLLGAENAFLLRLIPDGSGLVYSTYWGGSGSDEASAVAVDANGSASLVGNTSSSNFPIVNAVQNNFAGGNWDVFLSTFTTPSLGITPASLTVHPNVVAQFTPFGGSGDGYSFSIKSNGSGATIGSTTGQYKSGATANTTDVIELTDSGNHTATATVTVGPPLKLTPPSASVAPLGSVQFACVDAIGSCTMIFLGPSQGTLFGGTYTAGPNGNVTDTIQAFDTAGGQAVALVTVGPSLSIAPSSVSVPPLGVQSFVASGGAGKYAYAFKTNASGGSLNPTTGAYKAGGTANVTDVVTVSDANGASRDATINIGAGVSISPASPSTPPKGSIAFGASGGSGNGFAWSLQTNNSGATIGSSSGSYVAGGIGNTIDAVVVIDSLGNSATTQVAVGPGLSISPQSPTTPPMGSLQLAAIGGSGTGLVWSLASNPSGGTIDAMTGKYVAGSTGSVADIAAVADSLGNTASVSISVGGGIAINPANPSVLPGGTLTFSAIGGSNTSFTWSVATNNSGATIDSSGNYRAGRAGEIDDIVRAIDALGNAGQMTVHVGRGVSINPVAKEVIPGGTITFQAEGGDGHYVFALADNRSRATIDALNGVYRAGDAEDVTDVVRVEDSIGNQSTATVHVVGTIRASGGCDCSTSEEPDGTSSMLVVALLASRRRKTRR